MFNDLPAYYEMGNLVACAVRERDASRAKHHIINYRKMLRLESAEDRVKAEASYKEGYRNESNIPPAPFK